MLVSLTLKIDKDVKNKLERLAHDEDRSASAQLRIILDEYFKRK